MCLDQVMTCAFDVVELKSELKLKMLLDHRQMLSLPQVMLSVAHISCLCCNAIWQEKQPLKYFDTLQGIKYCLHEDAEPLELTLIDIANDKDGETLGLLSPGLVLCPVKSSAFRDRNGHYSRQDVVGRTPKSPVACAYLQTEFLVSVLMSQSCYGCKEGQLSLML